MISDRVTLKQGKTHWGRGLITDPISHVVTDADTDLWTKSAVWRGIHSDSRISDVYVRLSSAVSVSDVYSYSFGLHRYLIKKSDHNDRLLSTEATLGFC